MCFFQRSGWYCQFLEEDLKTPLPKTTTLDDPARLFEIAERGGYLMNLEGRQAIEHAIENGRGGVWLRLAIPETQGMNGQSERATSLAGYRPLCPIYRRSGSAPGSRRIRGLVRKLRAEPALPSLSVINVARVSSLPSFQLPGMSTVAGPLKCPWSALFFGRLLFRWF